MTTVRLGTRGSALAIAQSTQVARALERAAKASGRDLSVRLVEVSTRGDVNPASLATLGGTGAFAAALRTAVLAGQCDLAVHSYKDLPTSPTPGLRVMAVPPREDPRDALCLRSAAQGASVHAQWHLTPGADLPPVAAATPSRGLPSVEQEAPFAFPLPGVPRGARIGTGSPRRAAQLLAVRPDLEIVDIRGNVPTRLSRVLGSQVRADGTLGARRTPDLDGVVLALAGLRRLGLEDRASIVLPNRPDAAPTDPPPSLLTPAPVPVMVPAPGQGALAVETRDSITQELPDLAAALRALDDPVSHACADAERALMHALQAGCAAPVGALAVSQDGSVPQAKTWSAVNSRTPTALADPTPTIRLNAVVLSLDGSRRLSAHGVGPAEDAESLGQRVAALLLADGANDLTDLHATRPPRSPRS